MAETNIRGIFSIGDVRSRQLKGLVPEKNRETYREYGYVAGDFSGNSRVDRVDYSNDTTTAITRGQLNSSKQGLSATGNSNFGYFCGGDPGTTSTVDRIDYSNDSATALVRGLISSKGKGHAGAGNSNFGYSVAGYIYASPPILFSTVDRIDYSNDTSRALIRGPLSLGRGELGGTGNSNFGYFASGFTGSSVSTIDRINYSNDTATASARGPLSSARYGSGGVGNSNFGYFGGTNGLGTVVDRISYSNDTSISLIKGPLSTGRRAPSATGNSNFGYYIGGYTGGVITRIDRIDYSNDSVTASVRGPLPGNRAFAGATSSSSFGGARNSSFASNFTFPTVPNAGYFGGGSDGTNNLATIDKVDYANDTSTASVRSALSSARSYATATENSSFGYFCGGSPNPSTVNRLEYASDTQNTTVRGSLAVGQGSFNASVGDANFGYVGAVSAMNRIDYSNDLSTASNRGSLLPSVNTITGNSNYWSSTSSRSFGYFTGGYASGYGIWSGIQRLDFNNDTLVTSTRSFIPTPVQSGMSGFGNNNFGYFGGGLNPGSPTTIRKIDYSNDTATVSIRGPLSRSVNYLSSATGSQNFGYFGGGRNPAISPSTITSQVDRINYSNDTAIASIRGPLSSARSQLSATSPLAYGGAPIYFTNPLPTVFQKQIAFNDSNTLSSNLPFKRVLGSFGYFGGGNIPNTTTIDRINFSNDTQSSLQRGSLTYVRRYVAGTGNSNFGYFSGGENNAGVDRIDYSNDLNNAVSRGSLSFGADYTSGVGNSNFGYIDGGNSRIFRIDYSNDSSPASVRSFLGLIRNRASATGNLNFGYFGAGIAPGPNNYSRIDRINYSNDGVTPLVRGSLSGSRYGQASTGNNSFGYFGGGRTLSPYVVITTVDRIDYSNDTATASVRGPLTLARTEFGATGNNNFGYFVGGAPGPVSSVDRIDYANDTTLASIRAPLRISRFAYGATTNARTS